ncbi:hypothetical protein Ae717Ps2_6218 [Pseudonocardia sp. Ae717_Ps2]|uniref:hypothetical protein n=1 Tax=Pseudonocardia sp. Ae717_Ps2 TaxID=1885573 RepID=UPI00094B0AC1|nr:hypothetical protein [Pseudonocardia sp. Ae717_Ps2]OLM28622.1 hypothetical protein Ae717Ps2_6218 [Pseudonocardia sp. Ae717_Ps2]
MGENSRYERYAHHVDAETEAEASALRVVAGLVERGVPPIPDRVVAGRVAGVLRSAAAELSAGQPVPLQLRRTVRWTADALRAALDPRTSRGR